MVTIVKHEWHQVDEQYAIELTREMLEEIYPHMDESEMDELWEQVEDGEADLDTILEDAYENDVDLEWDHQYSDCWTSRKGGYDVTYEYGDEDSWHHEPPPAPPTHKCTKCKFKGQSYEFEWVWPEDDNEEVEASKRCPYCESPVELTEEGIEEQKKDEERRARWAREESED
jgi:hypothetical protein